MESKTFEIEVVDTDVSIRLDSFLGNHESIEITRTKAEKLITAGLVKVNGELSNKKYKVQVGDKIEVTIIPEKPTDIIGEDIPLDIVYEDDYLAVINKPAGMVTHPGTGNYSGTLVNAMIYYFKNLPSSTETDRPGIIHRLDKDTSGLIMIAKEEKAFIKMQKAIQDREVSRTYYALTCGHMKDDEGEINLPIGRSLKNRKMMAVTDVNSREAITTYKRLDRYRTYDLLEVNLQTGRTHQIRVHFAHLGHPVFGDPDYGGREKWHKGIFGPERPLAKKMLEILNRQALHAKSLEFNHPVTGQVVKCEIDLPDDFTKLIEILEKEGC